MVQSHSMCSGAHQSCFCSPIRSAHAASEQRSQPMKTSSLCFQAAVLFVLVGMGWGIQMAASHDHSAMPAHAHLNLLGWVSLFMFGVFYHLHPAVDASRAAVVQA